MRAQRKKAKAKPNVKFKDLKSKKNPKGGISFGASNPATKHG
jgi:hypothetical protein